MCSALKFIDYFPSIDQCHDSEGKFLKPKRAALVLSQLNPGVPDLRVEPPEVKSLPHRSHD
jgi:hypothetical protein